MTNFCLHDEHEIYIYIYIYLFRYIYIYTYIDIYLCIYRVGRSIVDYFLLARRVAVGGCEWKDK
jgi:hypothetical protein